MAASYEKLEKELKENLVTVLMCCAGKSDLVGLIKSFDQLEATQGARNKLIVVKINNVTQQAPG